MKTDPTGDGGGVQENRGMMERLTACQRENGSSFGGQSCMLPYQSQRRGVDPTAPCRGARESDGCASPPPAGSGATTEPGVGLVGCMCWSCQTPVDMLQKHAVETGKAVKAARHEQRSEGASQHTQHTNWRNTTQATAYVFVANSWP